VGTTAVAFITAMARLYPHIQGSVCLLLQHICTTAPDREEYRDIVAAAVGAIAMALAPDALAGFLAWVCKCSRSTRVAHRVLAVGVICKIAQRLAQGGGAGSAAVGEQHDAGQESFSPSASMDTSFSAATEGTEDPAAASTTASHIALLLDTLVSRSSDKAASVRGKALTHLASIFNLAGSCQAARQNVDRLLSCPALQGAAGLLASPRRADNDDLNGAGAGNFLATIRRRAADPKSIVRKASLQAIGALAAMSDSPVGAAEIAVLHHRCMDSVLSVRRQAMLTFTDLLLGSPARPGLHQPWLDAVLPLVMDREDSVRTRSASCNASRIGFDHQVQIVLLCYCCLTAWLTLMHSGVSSGAGCGCDSCW